ncbi:MAG TPA: GDSL-type esterase/lipase family protein [Clostridiales bacterium]|nr:GDSL-type esterase/lipase family protein [Clostridiales bacterium]
MKENSNLKIYSLSDIRNMKVHGRMTGRLSPLTLFWTGSGVEFNVKGSELWIEVETDYDVYEPWISILINSYPVARQMVTAGRHWLCVFRGMNAGAAKNVRIMKDVQPMSFDKGCLVHIHSVRFDGEFLPVEDRPYKIEFIGDSITSGEGTVGASCEQDWIPMWFSAADNYTYLTAKALNADYRVVSQSGWGVLTGWDNNPNCSIPRYYEQICGILPKENCAVADAFGQNDFDEWQPDVIVVNLGTNDANAFSTPEWVDEASGARHKQRLNEDGTFNEEDLAAFENAAAGFLGKLRKYNKNAHIVWAYGMFGAPLMPSIYRAADTYIRSTGDRKVSIFQLPNTTNETMGSRSHPGKHAHEKAAKELTNYIIGLLPQK